MAQDPALLWLRYWPAATAPIRPLDWELSYATGASLKRPPKKKKKKREREKKRKKKRKRKTKVNNC